MNATSTEDAAPKGPAPSEPASYSTVLILWMGLVVALNTVRWIGGFPAGQVAEGVERGVARAEVQARGESTEEQVRKAIRSQRDTKAFWTALVAIDDFLIEPVLLAARALLVATLFTGFAAIAGRPPQYDRALLECSRIQGLWVLGIALRVALLISLRRPEDQVETSLALLLPPGHHPAWLWVALRQLDLFALTGWATLAVAAWRRGEAVLVVALAICAGLGLTEVATRTGVGWLLGAAIRLSLVVE